MITTQNNNKQVIVTGALLLVLSIAPFLMQGAYHDSQRLLSVFITSSLIACHIFTSNAWSKTSLSTIAIIAVWGALGSAESPNTLWSHVEVALFVSIAISTIIIFKDISDSALLKLAIFMALAQLTYITRDYLIYFFYLMDSRAPDPVEIIDGFSNRRFYGQFLSWTLPFLIAILAIKKELPFRKTLLSIAILSCTLVYVSGTRAFLLGMIFSVLCVAWVNPNTWKSYFRQVIIISIGGLAGYLLLTFLIPHLAGVDTSLLTRYTIERDFTNSSGRVAIWGKTLDIALANPVTGIGPMMLADESIIASVGVAHPHNLLLQIMAEWGIPFAMMFSGLILYITLKWRGLIRQSPDSREKLSLPITASVSSAAAVSLVDGIAVMPVSLTYMAVILGCGAALWREWTPEVRRFKLPIWVAGIFLLFVSLPPAFSARHWLTAPPTESMEMTTRQQTPRFWADGRIPSAATANEEQIALQKDIAAR